MALPTQDVLIIGAGPAGMSAALYLGRARKRVLVLDAGTPRHAVSPAVHNMISRDGISPHDLRTETWRQMRAYETVAHLPNTQVVDLVHDGAHWHATTSEGTVYTAPTTLLAMGVVDEHPDIPGYEAFWGHTIHHCPYCHGWELRDKPLAVLAHDEFAAHMAPMLRGWSKDVMVVTHGKALDEETARTLKNLNIPVLTSPIVSLEGQGKALHTIRFEDGHTLARQGIFVMRSQHPVPLVAGLDLEMQEAFVTINEHHMTSLPNLWAAGDLCSPRAQQVLIAATQGGLAGTMINMALMNH